MSYDDADKLPKTGEEWDRYQPICLGLIFILATKEPNPILILPCGLPPPPGGGLFPVNPITKELVIKNSVLTQAYLYASRILRQTNHQLVRIFMWDRFHVASVILLFQPENVSAANARKKAILHCRQQNREYEKSKGTDTSDFSTVSLVAMVDTIGQLKLQAQNARWNRAQFCLVVETEVGFLGNLLTSPLPRHNKSPNLWAYRRWLIHFALCCGCPSKDLVLQELQETVMVAAGRQPRNYYAWSYMRWLLSLNLFYPSAYNKDGWARDFSSTPPQDGVIGSLVTKWIYITVVELMVIWCLEHPDDTSGWSFLSFLLSPKPVGAALRWSPECECLALLNEKFEHILKVTIKQKWKHASVWTFLRTVASCEEITRELRIRFLKAFKRSRHQLNHLIHEENWYMETKTKTSEMNIPLR